MQSYKAPLRDMEFLLKEVHSVSDLSATQAYQSIDDEEALAILAEAARIHEDVLAPLNAIGDREGCHYKEGEVTTPTGFRSAYKQFTEAGWGAINATTAYGGQGLSHVRKGSACRWTRPRGSSAPAATIATSI